MKTLKQTIIVILAISLLAAGVVPAKNVSDEVIQAVELQIKQAELEQQSRAEVAAAQGQYQHHRWCLRLNRHLWQRRMLEIN